MLRQSPRRNGRNKGLKVKHVVQISMLLGVSIWLLYQVHHSDVKRTPSVTTRNISHNVSSNDVFKLGRKDLRNKVNGSKEHQADEQDNDEKEASEDVVEDHESDEREEDGENENEKGNGDKGHEQNDKKQMKDKQREENKGKEDENKSNEQNKDVGMEKSEKEDGKKMSTNSKEKDNDDDDDDDDDQGGRDENENDKMMNNGENDGQNQEDGVSSSKGPSVDYSEEQNKDVTDSYSFEPNTANTMKSTWNDKNMKAAESDLEVLKKIGKSVPNTEFEQKDGVSVLEEEKDALTDLETLPESGTGGSITQENTATE